MSRKPQTLRGATISYRAKQNKRIRRYTPNTHNPGPVPVASQAPDPVANQAPVTVAIPNPVPIVEVQQLISKAPVMQPENEISNNKDLGSFEVLSRPETSRSTCVVQ